MNISEITSLLLTALNKCTEWLGTFFDSINGTFSLFITLFIIFLVVKRLLGPLIGGDVSFGSSDTVKAGSEDTPSDERTIFIPYSTRNKLSSSSRKRISGPVDDGSIPYRGKW